MADDTLKNPMCCVHCGATINEVYVQYSPGNIRLTKCVACKCVADEYVECEMMIILIDLILHKSEAYRHLFFNYPNLNKLNMKDLIWKTSLLFLLLDSCRQSLMGAGKGDTIKWDSLPAFVSTAGKLIVQVLVQNLFYFSTILVASGVILRTRSHSKFSDYSIGCIDKVMCSGTDMVLIMMVCALPFIISSKPIKEVKYVKFPSKELLQCHKFDALFYALVVGMGASLFMTKISPAYAEDCPMIPPDVIVNRH